MQQFAVTCPNCRFVLQFYDSTLLGRKGRCPKCRHKFVLEQPEKAEETREQARPTPAKPKSAASPPSRAPSPAAAKVPSPSPKSAAAGREKSEQPWETDFNRGLGFRKTTLSARWVFPDALSIWTVAVVGVGAAGAGALANLLVDPDHPYFGPILALSAALGGAIAAGCLVRRHNPSLPTKRIKADDHRAE